MSIRLFRVALLLLLCLGLCAPLAALAEGTPEPSPTPTSVPEDREPGLQYYLYSSDPQKNLLSMKSALNDLHYYASGAPDEARKSDFFDDYTLNALRKCCEVNPELTFSPYGVTNGTYFAIVQGRIKDASATPAPTTQAMEDSYPPFGPEALDGGQGNGNISLLQRKLKELGYDQRDDGTYIDFVAGKYDYNMYESICIFCRQNGYAVPDTRSVIDSNLQAAIAESNVPRATPTPEPEPDEDQDPNKLRRYFTSDTTVLGFTVPTWSIWVLGVVLMVVLVLIILHFFMSDSGKSGSSGGSGSIQFIIEYEGKKRDYRCDIDHTLKIGRGIGDFPIDVGDLTLSRKHCEIYHSGKSLMIRDYSSGGTFVNGKPCNNGEYVLHSNDTIKIGKHVITIIF